MSESSASESAVLETKKYEAAEVPEAIPEETGNKDNEDSEKANEDSEKAEAEGDGEKPEGIKASVAFKWRKVVSSSSTMWTSSTSAVKESTNKVSPLFILHCTWISVTR